MATNYKDLDSYSVRYGKANTKGIRITRTNKEPWDVTDVFDSVEAFDNYLATSPVVYAGQLCAVVNNSTGAVDVYKVTIEPDGSGKKYGKSALGSAGDVSALTSRVSALESDNTTNKTNIATNTSNITNLQGLHADKTGGKKTVAEEVTAGIAALDKSSNVSDAAAGITVQVDEVDGIVSKPIVTVTSGTIASGDTSVVTGGAVYTAIGNETTRAKGVEGTLSNLTTEAKSNLVAAINEVDAHADAAQSTIDSFKNRTDGFATAAQGTKADSAIQDVSAKDTEVLGNAKYVKVAASEDANHNVVLTTDVKTQAVADAVASGENMAKGLAEASDVKGYVDSAVNTEKSARETAVTGEETRAKGVEGALSNLTTEAKGNLVAAINEVDAHADSATTAATTAQTSADNRLNTIIHGLDGSYVTVTVGEKTGAAGAKSQSVSAAVTVQGVSGASSTAKGLAEASDVKTYVDTAVSGEATERANAITAAKNELKGTSESASSTATIAGAKKYADEKVAALDHTSTGAAGSYIQKVAQVDGVITETVVTFDKTIDATTAANDNNVASTKAVKTYVDAGDAAEASARDTAITTAKSEILGTKGAANGIASLDANAKIPLSQIPDAILGQMLMGGTVAWNTGNEGIVTLSQGLKDILVSKDKITATETTIQVIDSATDDKTQTPKEFGYKTLEGCYFISESAGTVGSTTFAVGDWLVAIGTKWAKIDNTDAVTGVKGSAESTYRIGNVSISKADIGLGNVDNTSDANKPVSTAQSTAISGAKSEAISAAQTYADAIKVNGQSQTSQAITITGANVNVGGSGSHKDETVAASIEALYTSASGKVASVSKGTDGSYFTTTIGGTATAPTVAGAVTIQAVEGAGTSAKGLAEASDVKGYVDSKISTEASDRSAADTTLQNNIDAEATARGNADTTLQSNIDAITATGTGTIDTRIANAIAGLDAEKTGKNTSEQIAVKVTEVDGKISAVTVTADKFDLDGAASTAESNAKSYTNTEIQKLDAEVVNTAASSGSTASSQVKVQITEVDGKLSAVTVTAPEFELSGTTSSAIAALDKSDNESDAVAGIKVKVDEVNGIVSKPVVTVTSGTIASGDTSVVTGGAVYTAINDEATTRANADSALNALHASDGTASGKKTVAQEIEDALVWVNWPDNA